MSDDQAEVQAPQATAAPVVEEQHATAVVAVGASAASLGSLEVVLTGLLRRSGGAAVVVLHADVLDEAELLRQLSAWSGMAAALATDGTRPGPDKVYLAPQGKLLTLRAGRLRVADAPESAPGAPGPGAPGPASPATPPEVMAADAGALDTFLVSLASELRENAISVVLAGTGSDGTLGTAVTKERGGLAIAEEPGEREDMELAQGGASATSIADFVVPAQEIAGRVASYVAHIIELEHVHGLETLHEEAETQLSRIANVLRNRTGHDFHGYKQNTFLRRVQRRMQVVQIDGADRYVEYLRAEPDEIQHLFQDLLIGVTQFFRDKHTFDLLEGQLVPALFEGKGRGDSLRVWVLGCATGEEAYSIAMLMREHMARLETPPRVQIFATDIDGRALASARAGRYTAAIARDLTPERLARWFVREGDTYAVAKELREMCVFSQHNIIRDAPFSRIDLISCRNLLIYLNADLQNRVIPLFHFALRPGGILFLGPAENVTRHGKLFAAVARGHRVYRRLESATPVLPMLPLQVSRERQGATGNGDGAGETFRRYRESPRSGSTRRAERIAERFAPAYAVVDDEYEVLHFSGRTGRFLDPAAGAASLNLLNLVHRDLRLDLRSLLHRAVTTGQPVRADALRVGGQGGADGGNGATAVNLIVECVPGDDDEPLTLVVLFQEVGPAALDGARGGGTGATAPDNATRDEHVRNLEAELRLTKERLQAAVEELETTNEELKASNEEYQSVNEELQSANEELETSKEELQSINEELQTVNAELNHRVNELARANSDVKNLLESTQIATVFLDNDLQIRNFTPAATEIFRLVESDLGRPIAHIAPRIAYVAMEEDVHRVLRTLSPAECEVEDTVTGKRYLVRVLPYRSVNNFIAGAVLTFFDVTATARAERALRESEERFRMMAQAVPAFLYTTEADGRCDYVNPRFYEYTGLPDGAALGDGWLACMHPDDVEAYERRWRRSRETGDPFEHESRLRDARGEYRWFQSRATAQPDAQGRPERWFGARTDTHERRLAEARQRLLLHELQHRVKNILAVVRSVLGRTLESSDTLEDFAAHLEGRISALARTQSVLARTGGGTVDLEEMVRNELATQGGQDGERLDVSGPPVALGQKVAEILGLALHELATNAVKYGALAAPRGRVAVRWRVYGGGTGPRLALEWQEMGVPLTDTMPARHGFGRELIERGLPYDLGATTALEFLPGGVRCAIELPLAPPRSGGLGGLGPADGGTDAGM